MDSSKMDLIQKVYFTDEKVNDFLVNKIDFANWKIILHRDKKEFLTYLLQKHFMHIYFQNLRMASVPVDQRATPTIEQMIENGFNGRGGVCLELNYFLHLLLTALGFDTFIVRAHFPGSIEDCHLMTVVRTDSGAQEQLFLFDVASANPMDVPIPLHELPHRRLTAETYYEFRRHNLPGNVTTHGRYQIGGTYLGGPSNNPDFDVLRYEFDLIPRSLEYFKSPMHEIFTNPEASGIFLRQPFLFRYLKHEFTEPDDNEWVLVFGLRILVATKNNRKVVKYGSYKEMVPAMLEYFPKLDLEEVRLAFELFEKVLKEGKADSFNPEDI